MKLSKSVSILIVLFQTFSIGFAQDSNFIERYDSSYLLGENDWVGDLIKFQIRSGQLWTNSDIPNDEFYVAKLISRRESAEWSTEVYLPFATSSSNYVEYYIWSDSSILNRALNSFFVRVGDTKDQLVLIKRTNGFDQAVSKSLEGITHNLHGTLVVRLTTDSLVYVSFYDSLKQAHVWSDSIRIIPDINQFWLGLLVKQSTSSFHKKHHFDNFYYGPIREDSLAPDLIKIEAQNEQDLWLYFNEAIDTSWLQLEYFFVDNGIGNPAKITPFGDSLKLKFEAQFKSRNYELSIAYVSDVSGNFTYNLKKPFYHVVFGNAGLHDIVITEILPDPSPSIGLPEFEYVELLNRSNEIINLNGWTLSDKGKTVKLPSYNLWPDSFVVICDKSSNNEFAFIPNKLLVDGMISLNNATDSLKLTDNNLQVVFELNYSVDWHSNEWKKQGGWSLEMIDTDFPCMVASNWASSISNSGGSPGKSNSASDKLFDRSPPRVIKVAAAANKIVLHFDESLVRYAPNISHFEMEDLQVEEVNKLNSYTLSVTLFENLLVGRLYTLRVSGINDCSGNQILDSSLFIGVGREIQNLDIVLNEVMYDVSSGCVEFFEIYNSTDFVVDAKDVYVGIKDTNNQWNRLYPISETSHLILPSNYWAITSDSLSLKRCKNNATHIIQAPALPTLVNEAGNIGLSDKWGNTVDAVLYSDKMHFPLLSNTKDVSLERINPKSTTSSWTSAAQSHQYATPGYPNSQMYLNSEVTENLVIQTDPVSPNSDGYNDILIVTYVPKNLNETIHLQIYDQYGRLKAFPVNTGLAGSTNQYIWDCVDSKGTVVPNGIYIVYVESISVDGSLNRYRKVFTVVK